jgi:hypothetical protein
MGASEIRRAVIRRFTSEMTLTMALLCLALFPASAEETNATVMLDVRKCVCHPGLPCECTIVLPSGKTFIQQVPKETVEGLSKRIESLSNEKE